MMEVILILIHYKIKIKKMTFIKITQCNINYKNDN